MIEPFHSFSKVTNAPLDYMIEELVVGIGTFSGHEEETPPPLPASPSMVSCYITVAP